MVVSRQGVTRHPGAPNAMNAITRFRKTQNFVRYAVINNWCLCDAKAAGKTLRQARSSAQDAVPRLQRKGLRAPPAQPAEPKI